MQKSCLEANECRYKKINQKNPENTKTIIETITFIQKKNSHL